MGTKKTRKRHTRRKRRQYKQTLAHGKTAKRSHTRKGGRTGSIHSRKLTGAKPRK